MLAPCAVCTCDKSNWSDFERLTADGHGWVALDLEAFEAAIAPCERRVRLDPRGYSDVRR